MVAPRGRASGGEGGEREEQGRKGGKREGGRRGVELESVIKHKREGNRARQLIKVLLHLSRTFGEEAFRAGGFSGSPPATCFAVFAVGVTWIKC